MKRFALYVVSVLLPAVCLADGVVVPSKVQVEWADCEVGALFHIDMCTFKPDFVWNKSPEVPPADTFNPEELDTDQWILAAKNIGAKYAVLVAKHCSGFSLWPTKAHEYSVKNSKWRNGKGDIVRDFIASCKKYGVKPGIYASANANAYMRVYNGKYNGGSPTKEYGDMVNTQLRELWSNYGPLFEIWFDGGSLPEEIGGNKTLQLLEELQPDAIAFQGPSKFANLIRWVGNEKGTAPYPSWGTAQKTTSSDGTEVIRDLYGDPFAKRWCPGESDFPLRWNNSFQGGWFWKDGEDHKIFSVEELMQKYETSVGRNTNMLVGIVVDSRGLVPEADVKRLKEWGAQIQKFYGSPLKAETEFSGEVATAKFESPKVVDRAVIQEDIAFGERILEYKLEGFSDGKWIELSKGTCIGHKRIEKFAPAKISAMRLTAIKSKAQPKLKALLAFEK